MRHGAAHPTATGALLDHHGGDHEWLHLQCHDVLEEKLAHEEAHHLDVIVLQQLINVGIVG